MRDKIIEILKANVAELEEVEITEGLKLITGGFMDSFDIIGLISEFEEAFNTSIPLEDVEIEQFDSVIGIENIIKACTAA
ncbi:Phosphopantetheine attachment site [Lachnospiraceae bacterium KH1T2]|nr:Phosphopantetheine attachment site [Lachnospiraceae bacterium KH1T2]